MSENLPYVQGTARHYMSFLDWAAEKGELPKTTVDNWRNATRPVLEIEPEWLDLDLMEMDLDQFFSRFETLNRTRYSQNSLSAYRSRFRTSIETFRAWMANDPGWKPNTKRRATSSRGPGQVVLAKKKAQPKASAPSAASRPVPAGRPASAVNVIEYPFPVRSGVQARLVLPDDLTVQEAKRISAFISSLAVPDDAPPDPPA